VILESSQPLLTVPMSGMLGNAAVAVTVGPPACAGIQRCFGSPPTLPRDVPLTPVTGSPIEARPPTPTGTRRGMFPNPAGGIEAGYEATAAVPTPVVDVPAAPRPATAPAAQPATAS